MKTNLGQKTFTANGAFTPPPGCTSLRVIANQPVASFGYQRGERGAVVITQAGLCYGWGLNSQGEAGIGSQVPASSPTLCAGSAFALSAARLYPSHSGVSTNGAMFALSKSGQLWAWGGTNSAGQLGDGSVTPRSSPVLVTGNVHYFKHVIANLGSAIIALTQAGVAYAWGTNTNGQLGVGDVNARSSPVAVLGGLVFSTVVVPPNGNTNAAALGLTTDGVAYSWGNNTHGQLGVGDVTPRSSPVLVLGGNVYSQVFAGHNSFYGIATDGTYAWGLNQNGQLGDGSVTPRSSPVLVLGSHTFTKIVAHTGSGSPSSSTVLALDSAGAAWAWGNNSSGQIGDGTVAAKSSPVAVLGGHTFVDIFQGGQSSNGACYGLKSDGSLYAWGLNQNGELGVGDVTPRSSPVLVLGGFTWKTMFPTFDGHVFAVTTDGQLYSWGGANANGGLGHGDVTPKSSPVAVVGAFRADMNTVQKVTDVACTPGTEVTVTVTDVNAKVGSTVVGWMVSSLTIQFLQ